MPLTGIFDMSDDAPLAIVAPKSAVFYPNPLRAPAIADVSDYLY
jgi:hypothetical protein